jgi:hypothetical protein
MPPRQGAPSGETTESIVVRVHYVEDYRALVGQVCRVGAAFVCVSKAPAGDFPTFATAQLSLSGQPNPVWFFNRQELVDLFAAHGYSLVNQGRRDRAYDTSNFPAERRWRQASHFLFA